MKVLLYDHSGERTIFEEWKRYLEQDGHTVVHTTLFPLEEHHPQDYDVLIVHPDLREGPYLVNLVRTSPHLRVMLDSVDARVHAYVDSAFPEVTVVSALTQRELLDLVHRPLQKKD